MSRGAELTVSGKLHPLESVSRQLDPIDLDDDDWGLQEVRATTDVIAEGTADTVTMTTDTANTFKQLVNAGDSSVVESRRESGVDGKKQWQQQSSERERESEKPNGQ